MDNFDTERFIIEIQARPSIWDSSSQEYSNRDLKKKCWEEIVDLFGEEQSVEKKRDLGLVLQKRWKSIRSCYLREVKRQKNVKSGSGATSRKSEYIFFKQLQFLQKVVAIREEDDEEEDEEEKSESVEVEERPKQKNTKKCKRQSNEDEDPFVRALNNSIEQRRREKAEQKLRETGEADEDRLFLLSMLNTLKNLPPHVKMATKIKMLTLLNVASGFSVSRSSDYADRSFRYTNSPELNRESPNSDYLTQRRTMVGSEYCGTSYKTSSSTYSNETVAKSPYSGYTTIYSNSPSNTHDSVDSESYMDLYNSQN